MTSFINSKKRISNSIAILFLIFVAVSVFFTEVFQAPIKNSIELAQSVKLFPPKELNSITKISLKNKSGNFIFDHAVGNEISPWKMIVPRSINANSTFMDKLLTSLQNTNIKKIYNNDKINNSNFSLEKPNATLTITNNKNVTTQIDVGLLNTIDNSIYLKFSNRTGIYHVEALGVSLENATLLDLIESKIITIDVNNIISFKIYRGKKGSKPTLEILKKDNHWISRDGAAINVPKLEDYLQDIASIKSSFILDKQTEAQKRQINSLNKKTEYTLSIEDSKSNTIDYSISGIIRDLADVDLKNESYFLISISNNSTAYVIKKEFYDLFEMKVDKIKEAQAIKTPTKEINIKENNGKDKKEEEI